MRVKGEPGLLGDLREDFRSRLCGIARPHQIEDAEFHRPLLHSVLAVTVAAMDRGVKQWRWRRRGAGLRTGAKLSKVGTPVGRHARPRKQAT